MVFKSTMQGSTQLQLVNILTSYLTILLCGINAFHFDDILNVGKLSSVTIYIIAAIELARWAFNRYFFRITTIGSVQRANVKGKATVFTKIRSVCKLLALLMSTTLLYAVACILMGAPLHTNYEQTFTLSLMLTVLTILPIGLFLGPTGLLDYLFYDTAEMSSRNEIALLDYLRYNAVAALLGTWCGSVVAPLDWDRDWQTYPIPNMLSGLMGFGLANTHMLLLTAFDMTKKGMAKGKKNL